MINGENASYQGNKLMAMGKRTKEQYLKSYSETLCTSTLLVPGPGKRSTQGNAYTYDQGNFQVPFLDLYYG